MSPRRFIMTEGEWIASTDPERMLLFLEGKEAAGRKLRLFAVGCCRSAWDRLSGRSRSAVITAERHIDGNATEESLAEARRTLGDEVEDEALHVEMLDGDLQVPNSSPQEEDSLLREYRLRSIRLAITEVAYLSTCSELDPEWLEALFAKHLPRDWAVILRDIFGPLLFRSVVVQPTWLTPSVVALAETVYRNRDFDGMPVLGDALEEAGCDNTDVLTHCRSDAAHVRGCWVVDAILGKS